MTLTSRQIKILEIIIDYYSSTALPVSSKEIIHNYLKDYSSATIRNEMAALEKFGLIEKTHTSSGRIPTVAGYDFYDKNILKPKVSSNLKYRLQQIFSQRDLSINTVIDESVSIISESLKLPSVLTTTQKDDLLKRFDLIQISDDTAIVLLVTSSGTINKNTIKLTNKKQLADIVVCVRIFNDRLIDTPISQVETKLNSIKEIIRSKVQEYDFCIRQIVEKIFSFNEVASETNFSGAKWLTSQPEFKDIAKLNKILELLENSDVWKHLSFSQQKNGNSLITFGKEFGVDDLAVASVALEVGNTKHQLSIVGPTRMNYPEVKGLLEFLKIEIEKMNNKEK